MAEGRAVSAVRLSRYIDPANRTEQSIWRNRYDNVCVGAGPLVAAIVDEILASKDFTFPSILHYIVYYELLDAGYLVPLTVSDEERYLSMLRPLKKGIAFFDFPFRFIHDLPRDTQAVIFGVPCHLGSYTGGANNGPVLLRKASKRHYWRSGSISDAFTLDGDVHPSTHLRWCDIGDISLKDAGSSTWRDCVESIIDSLPDKVIPVMLGGDHSFSYASIKAISRKSQRPLCVVQFDHHLDVDLTGPFDRDQPTFVKPINHSNFVSHVHELDPSIHFLQLGMDHYQCTDSGAREAALGYLKKIGRQVSNLRLADMSSGELLGLIPVEYDVYISFDVDVISMSEIRTTGNPAPLGISILKAISLLVDIVKNRRVVAMDIMEFGVVDQFVDVNAEAEADKLVCLLAQVLNDLSPLE